MLDNFADCSASSPFRCSASAIPSSWRGTGWRAACCSISPARLPPPPERSDGRSKRGRRSASWCPATTRARTPRRRSATAAAVDYPDFEIIAINDGSRDNTAEVLDRLAARIPNLRVVHLAANQGKATALNAGALLARHEFLVCIDGDALLDPHALRWIARDFPPRERRGHGRQSAHPQPHHAARPPAGRRVLLHRRPDPAGPDDLWAAVHGLGRDLRLPQARPRDAGWWSPRTITDDIDITWRVQFAGWRVVYEPQCHRLDPDARDAQGAVAPAPALGRRRRADDDRLLRPHGALHAIRPCCRLTSTICWVCCGLM